MLQQANKQYSAGNLTSDNHEVVVETGAFLQTADDVGNVVVGVYSGKPVYLRDVADIVDGAEEPSQYVFFGSGAANKVSADEPAVTISIAKRPGANAISVARQVLKKVETLKGYIIPADVQVTVTRNYGVTAEDKSNELLWHMLLAVVSVSFLILLVLGWRESIIVLLAIPATLALTLLIFYLYGFTLNRITLFALIFSIGILVDDAIVVVENIVRHFHLPESKGRSRTIVAIEAVGEVGNPTILATFAVIAAVLPMAFVGGLMGPYMRPIPIGASAAMFFSLAISFIVTPWAAIRILQWRKKIHLVDSHAPDHEAASENFFGRMYRGLMTPLIASAKRRYQFLAALVVLLLVSMSLVYVGWVKVKMLPFDNKSEFQIILNMPEGSSLERTAQAAREIAAAVRTEPEVTDYEIYAGVASPFNFNGLVRHYFMRRGANVADLQINLVPKSERKAQSHDIAKRVRPRVAEIAAKFGARVAVAEVPPGPPVLQTLVAEIYGPTEENRLKLAQKVIDIFHHTPGVVDTDWYIEADQPKVEFVIDKEKAALHGISAETISQTLKIAVGGESVDLLHVPREKEDVNIVLQLPLASRSNPEELLALRVRSGDANALPEPTTAGSAAPLVPLRELVTVKQTITDKSIYHKNLMPVTYVIGDVAGVVESPVYAILKMNDALAKLDTREFGGDGSQAENLQRRAAVLRPAALDEMGWRMAYHHRSVPRFGNGVRRRAGADLHFDGRLVQVVSHSADRDGGDSVFAHRRFAGARYLARLFHGHFDDRLHGGRGHCRSQFHHSRGLHRNAAGGRSSAGRGGGRGGHDPVPSHHAHGAGGGGGRNGDSDGPDFSGAGDCADGREFDFHVHRAGAGAVALFHGVQSQKEMMNSK